jgi:YD repeat-containing protein
LKVSQINPTEATFSYIAYGSQVAEHGVCYATEPNPMRISSKKARAYKDVPIDLPESNTLITVTAEQLKPATKYYARAYVKNSSEETFYSNEISFSTASATAVGMRNNKDSLSGITQDTATLREFRRFNGVQTEKYENGNLMRVYNLQDGKLNGSFKFFNEKGQLVSDQNFSNGEPNGYYRTYYVSGQLRSEMNLKDGVQDGPTKEYFENGNLKMESNCSGPPFKASGQVKVYYENGQLRTETMLSNGVPTQSVGYDQDGRLVSEETPGNSIMYWYDRNGERHTTINGVEQK